MKDPCLVFRFAISGVAISDQVLESIEGRNFTKGKILEDTPFRERVIEVLFLLG